MALIAKVRLIRRQVHPCAEDRRHVDDAGCLLILVERRRGRESHVAEPGLIVMGDLHQRVGRRVVEPHFAVVRRVADVFLQDESGRVSRLTVMLSNMFTFSPSTVRPSISRSILPPRSGFVMLSKVSLHSRVWPICAPVPSLPDRADRSSRSRTRSD